MRVEVLETLAGVSRLTLSRPPSAGDWSFAEAYSMLFEFGNFLFLC
ncbi:MAG: hypothetical protein N3E41_08510 [Thermofilaceae archaeon]|nr:hypothetical protein [Thermofilaceae archaeon]